MQGTEQRLSTIGFSICLSRVWIALAITLCCHNAIAATSSVKNNDLDNSCILNCANNAVCIHSPDAPKLKRSGLLVDSCSCPLNYGGTSCDIPLSSCTQDSDCSGSFNPCVDGQCQNACAAAAHWLRSSFVEYACLKAMTDYCSNGEYCTHGGKCISGFQGSAAAKYTDSSLLCQCPKEFTGRHCERVNLPLTVPMPTPVYLSSSSIWKQRPLVIGFGITLAILTVCLATYLWMKIKGRCFSCGGRRKRRQSFSSDDDCMINPHNVALQLSNVNADDQILNSTLMAHNNNNNGTKKVSSSGNTAIRRISPRSSHNSSPTNEEEGRSIV